MGREVALLAFCLVLLGLCGTGEADVVELTDSNVDQLREGEWMIKFHAPWCPACQQFAAPWISLDRKLKESRPDVKFADVDVTVQTVLSGRFLIQRLPTLFHAKDGQYRVYDGERSEADVEAYVTEERWKNTDPLPWYSSPMGPSGIVLGHAMVAGQYLENWYTVLTKKQGVPSWLVIACGAVTVITAGMLIGLALVVCMSYFNKAVAPQVPQPQPVARPIVEDPNFGSTGENDEPDRKKGVKTSASPSPKASPQPAAAAAAAAKASPGGTTSPKQRKGKKVKASTD